MSTEVWGNLPKSQDDPELIEGAINRLISAHEADPDAHLGPGESLETHRQNEVLDHPAQSVLADKFNSYNMVEGRYTIGLMDYTDQTGTADHRKTSLYVGLSAQSEYKGYLSSSYFLDDGGTLDISFYVNIQAQADDTAMFGFFFDDDDEFPGPRIDNVEGTWYIRYYDDEYVLRGEAEFAVTTNLKGTCRFVWDDVAKLFQFYWQGVKVFELDLNDLTDIYYQEHASLFRTHLVRSGGSHYFWETISNWRAVYQVTT